MEPMAKRAAKPKMLLFQLMLPLPLLWPKMVPLMLNPT